VAGIDGAAVRTCQVNLDFSSEEDMIKKFRVGLALQVRPLCVSALAAHA
jgi:gamma-glutamylcysteine synthetase